MQIGIIVLASSPAELADARQKFNLWVDTLLERFPPASGTATVEAPPVVIAPTPAEPEQPAQRVAVRIDRSYRAKPQGTLQATPRAIILHGTRGGAQTVEREALAAARWAATNPNDLAWHATIGEDVVYVHLSPREWGWHAGVDSQTSLGVEFAQPTVAWRVNEAQIAAFGEWWRSVVVPAWPNIDPRKVSLIAHSETAQGKRDGKTDVYPPDDARLNWLKAQLRKQMQG
jgi:hypothetical protein